MPVGSQQPRGFAQARLEEGEVIVEAVAIGGFGEQPRLVALAAEARAVARRIGGGRERLAGLHLARVERGIYIDQLELAGSELRQGLHVLGKPDGIAVRHQTLGGEAMHRMRH